MSILLYRFINPKGRIPRACPWGFTEKRFSFLKNLNKYVMILDIHKYYKLLGSDVDFESLNT